MKDESFVVGNIQLNHIMLAIRPHHMASAFVARMLIAESHAEISLASFIQHRTVHISLIPPISKFDIAEIEQKIINAHML